ncbi:MAG: hypothetical protein JST73_04735 [Actinobacteria bacterium]|nr:hypothetical protein [Actinomycetota bacterium]
MTTTRRPTARHSTRPSTSNPNHDAGGTHQGRLGAPTDTLSAPLDIRHAALTAQNWATYDYSTDATTVTATAPPQLTDTNVREIFWRTDEVPAADEQACVTWNETAASVPGPPIQPGLAMRIASIGPHNEGVKAVSVTENVIYAGVWVFNVHVWDTTNTQQPFTQIGSFDLSSVMGKVWFDSNGVSHSTLAAPPLHICGRTAGNTFSFKVWANDEPEPSWSDPGRVRAVFLPPGWDYAGYSGGYIGHLHAGQAATATAELPTALS